MDGYEMKDVWSLGDSKHEIRAFSKVGAPILFIALHGDEPLAYENAKRIVSEYGGTAISLNKKPERFVEFTIDGTPYSFDPNRIFSREGIEATLKKTNKYTDVGNCSEAAVTAVSIFAQQIIDLIETAEIIIAVHNNSDGDYHIDLYREDELSAEAAEVHVHEEHHRGNFFLVIHEQYFHAVKKHWSCVLQHHAPTDDGSLSVYCAKHNKPYINCEADEDHPHVQVQMLRHLMCIFGKGETGT